MQKLLTIEKVNSWGQRVLPQPGTFIVATSNGVWTSLSVGKDTFQLGDSDSGPVVARGIYLGEGYVAAVDMKIYVDLDEWEEEDALIGREPLIGRVEKLEGAVERLKSHCGDPGSLG